MEIGRRHTSEIKNSIRYIQTGQVMFLKLFVYTYTKAVKSGMSKESYMIPITAIWITNM